MYKQALLIYSLLTLASTAETSMGTVKASRDEYHWKVVQTTELQLTHLWQLCELTSGGLSLALLTESADFPQLRKLPKLKLELS